MAEQAAASGPDFSRGIALSNCPEQGTLAGRVGDDPVLLTRIDGAWFAVSGSCTHYGAALADGLIGSEEVRCPLHHACFDLRTGKALRAPGLDPLDRWKVEAEGERLFIREKLPAADPETRGASEVKRVVIVGVDPHHPRLLGRAEPDRKHGAQSDRYLSEQVAGVTLAHHPFRAVLHHHRLDSA